MITLCIICAIALLGLLSVVAVGVRAILELCGQLERDRRREYRITPRVARTAPEWIGRAAK